MAYQIHHATIHGGDHVSFDPENIIHEHETEDGRLKVWYYRESPLTEETEE